MKEFSIGRPPGRTSAGRRRGPRMALAAGLGSVLAGLGVWGLHRGNPSLAAMAMAPPAVTVGMPLSRSVTPKTGFLGQFSAVDRIDLHAQVGGTLTEIHFTDGQIVHKGDPLFVIDPRPYQIALEQAIAQARAAGAQLDLANSELWRAQQLKRTDFGTVENVDQRNEAKLAAEAALEQANAAIHNAQLDLEYCHVTAPFTGRIGAHQVSVGSLVTGSRGGTGANTLLTSLVSLDPIHLDFDMSESDFLTYQRALHAPGGPTLDNHVSVTLGDETRPSRTGTLDFLDNALDRGSGTIHARATLANTDLFLAPGEFARLRLPLSGPRRVLLIPAASVLLDQSQQLVLTVAPDGTVVPKTVQTGELEQGLRVVRSGLAPGDRVIIDGLVRAQPGMRVTPVQGVIRPGPNDQG